MWIEGWLDRVFGTNLNPMYWLGGLGFYFYWIVAVSGLYVYAFFDTGLTEAYSSVESLTVDQWWLGGLMRSLHRYASDALIVVILIHLLHEFAYDRYRGARWYSWVIGVPTVWMCFAAGISGYWLVWDRLAQYVAEATTELLDWLPIFGSPIARNFLAPSYVDDRFFTLMLFIHIAVPLVMLFVMWFHVNRVSSPRINPPRALAVGSLIMLLVLSVVYPAVSQGPADLARVPSPIGLDWFYLWSYPLVDIWGAGSLWVVSLAGTFFLMAMPWLPPLPKRAVATVDLDNCNGCTRCAVDCPYGAIAMGARADGKPFERQAVVNPSLCVACGICTGSCPTSTPFRRAAALVPGIDLGWLPLAEIRDRTHKAATALSGQSRVLVFGCDHGVRVDTLAGPSIGTVSLPCTGMLPPSMIDYVVSRHLADGVVITGCRDGGCNYRLGPRWTEERINGERDPRLRARVPRERIARIWAAPTEPGKLARRIAAFQAELQRLPPARPAAATVEERAAP
jgi:ferredoxin/coenzyme F420-reducing hydrogenase delta subunit